MYVLHARAGRDWVFYNLFFFYHCDAHDRHQNIQKVIDRGDKLDDLQDKTGTCTRCTCFISYLSTAPQKTQRASGAFMNRGLARPGVAVPEGRDQAQEANVVEEHEAQPAHWYVARVALVVTNSTLMHWHSGYLRGYHLHHRHGCML